MCALCEDESKACVPCARMSVMLVCLVRGCVQRLCAKCEDDGKACVSSMRMSVQLVF